MASIEKTAYPLFPRTFPQAQLQRDFRVVKGEDVWLRKNTRSAKGRLAQGVLLKTYQRLRYFPEPEELPPELLDHLREELGVGAKIELDFGDKNTLFTYKRKVLEFEKCVRYYGKEAQAKAEAIALKAAEVKDNVVDIINNLIEALVSKSIELPAFSTLDRIAISAHATVDKRIVSTIVSRVDDATRGKILELLEVELPSRVSAFNRLKKAAGRASRKHVDELVTHLQWLESFGSLDEVFDGILDSKIRYFGRIGKALDAASLKDFNEDKRIVCVLSLLRLMMVQTRDSLGEMFLKRMAFIQKKAKVALQETQAALRPQLEELTATLGGVLHLVAEHADDTVLGTEVRKYVTTKHSLESLQKQIAEIEANSGNNYFPVLWEYFSDQRASLFRLLHALELESTTGSDLLIRAIEIVKANQHLKREWLEDNIDLGFCDKRWLKLLRQERGDGPAINRRLFEVCVFLQVATELRSGDLAIKDSEEFSDYRKDLMPWSECEKLLPAHCERLGIPKTAKGFRDWLHKELSSQAAALDAKFPESIKDVTLDDEGLPIARRVEAREIPESARRLREQIVSRMPERHLMDALCNTQDWFKFTRHFNHVTGTEAKFEESPTRYLMTIFAMGTNLGPAQAARHFNGAVSEHQLGMVNRRHFTTELLDKALREITEVYYQLDLPKYWGDAKAVAGDGTHYNFFDDNLISGLHFRYLKTGGVAYRHVTNNYIAAFRHFVGPSVHESVLTIEALMNAGLSVEADTIYSDTQGQSAAVFTYALLLGIKLMPRIRNWKGLTFYRPDAGAVYEHIDGLFTDVVKWDQIERGWKDVMQVAISISEGQISSARLLRKLGSHSSRNQLYHSAKAIGDVIRTSYLLRWIGDKEMRREVTANCNKAEAYHAFTQWTSFGGDVINTNDPEEQQKRLRYIDLVASALILQNAVDMAEIIATLRNTQTVDDNDLKFLSPYLTEHILRFGIYQVRLNRKQESWMTKPRYVDAANQALKVSNKEKSRSMQTV